MRPPGQAANEEWSAEFNSGSHHRVETPRDRIVADCAAPVGTSFSLVTGKIITGPQVAGTACGINTNKRFLKAEWLDRVRSRFGEADRVRMTDADLIRTYDISDDGIILRTIFETNKTEQVMVLDLTVVSIARDVADETMFDQASLKKSFVPDTFRKAPAPER